MAEKGQQALHLWLTVCKVRDTPSPPHHQSLLSEEGQDWTLSQGLRKLLYVTGHLRAQRLRLSTLCTEPRRAKKTPAVCWWLGNPQSLLPWPAGNLHWKEGATALSPGSSNRTLRRQGPRRQEDLHSGSQLSSLCRAASVCWFLPPTGPDGGPKRVAWLGSCHSAPFTRCSRGPPLGLLSSRAPETVCKGQG